MNIEAKAKEIWNSPSVDAQVNESNAEKWKAAVGYLGDKWLLKVPVQRKDK